jgi:hypothetical protein
MVIDPAAFPPDAQPPSRCRPLPPAETVRPKRQRTGAVQNLADFCDLRFKKNLMPLRRCIGILKRVAADVRRLHLRLRVRAASRHHGSFERDAR